MLTSHTGPLLNLPTTPALKSLHTDNTPWEHDTGSHLGPLWRAGYDFHMPTRNRTNFLEAGTHQQADTETMGR